MGSFLDRREVRGLCQFNGLAKLWAIVQMNHSTVIRFEECPENENGKQLTLSEFLRAIPMRVDPDRSLCDMIGTFSLLFVALATWRCRSE